MLDHDHEPEVIKQEEGDELLKCFRCFLLSPETDEDGFSKDTEFGNHHSGPTDEDEEKIIRIRFTPHQSLFQNGTNPIALLNELTEMGDARVIVHTQNIPEPEYFDPELCYLEWDVILKTKQSIESIRDVFIFVEDVCDLEIEIINTISELIENPNYKQLGKILVDRGDIAAEETRIRFAQAKAIGRNPD